MLALVLKGIIYFTINVLYLILIIIPYRSFPASTLDPAAAMMLMPKKNRIAVESQVRPAITRWRWFPE